MRGFPSSALRQAHGFTLIEILISVSLMLLLSGGAIANYSKFSDSQKLKQAASNVKNDLRYAYNKTVSGEKPAGCTQLVGYTVRFVSDGSTYSYEYTVLCTPALAGSPAYTSLAKLPSGISFSPLPSPVTFNSPDGRIPSPVSISLKSGTGETATLNISDSGFVSEGSFVPTPTGAQ